MKFIMVTQFVPNADKKTFAEHAVVFNRDFIKIMRHNSDATWPGGATLLLLAMDSEVRHIKENIELIRKWAEPNDG